MVSFHNTYTIDVLLTNSSDKEKLKLKLEQEFEKQKSYIENITYNSKIRISKVDDEWYLVFKEGETYKCDEWFGLLDFLSKNGLLYYMNIKKFEKFSEAPNYLQVSGEEFKEAKDRYIDVLNERDLFFIFNNIKVDRYTLFVCHYKDGQNKLLKFYDAFFAYSKDYFSNIKVVSIELGNTIEIFKDVDDYYWVTIFHKNYKCDDLIGLKNLLKDLKLYIGI